MKKVRMSDCGYSETFDSLQDAAEDVISWVALAIENSNSDLDCLMIDSWPSAPDNVETLDELNEYISDLIETVALQMGFTPFGGQGLFPTNAASQMGLQLSASYVESSED